MNKPFLYCIIIIASSLGLTNCTKKQNANSWKVYSPDSTLVVNVSLESGKVFYSVLDAASGDTVIFKSATGVLAEQQNFSDSFNLSGVSTTTIKEKYTMITGKRKENENFCQQLTLSLTNNNNIPTEIIFRAYHEGVAFRYHFPEISDTVRITGEESEFTISTKGKAWIQNYEMPYEWGPAYEAWYSYGTPIGSPAKEVSGWALPALFQTGDHYVLLCESGNDRNYWGAHLRQACDRGHYKIGTPLAMEAEGTGKAYAEVTGPFHTPWRIIMCSKRIGDIVESNLTHHLAPPSVIDDPSWVVPGRSSWSWWSDHASSRNVKTLKAYIDLSSKMGWEYSLVDANWNIMENGGNVSELLDYAKKRNVGLTLWYNSGGPHNRVTEQPRDIMSDPIKRKAEFKKLHEWGIKAVKVDFFNSDKQNIMAQYQDILRDAAEEQIMVLFHGCTAPRGWSRTYPNLVAMEAVKGAEQYSFDTVFCNNAPRHNTILAMTRNVVGPMDYTPVTFTDYKERLAHTTTNANELALAVIFESGFVHFADRASAYEQAKPAVQRFLRDVPVVWDDIRYLQGEPGKEIVLARRKGNTWYVAGINGTKNVSTFELALPFIAENANVSAFEDGANPRDIATRQFRMDRRSLSVTMKPKGGFIFVIQE
ncbi:MAG TPA: glycoside hydrolase family 97 catalytic domain-containing protein [Chryseolinea sp.]